MSTSSHATDSRTRGGLSVNPFTEETIQSYPALSIPEVCERIEQCHLAHLQWKQTAVVERARLLLRLAELLRDQATDQARLMALEMGKPLEQGIAEIEKCAALCEYYADHSGPWLEPQSVETEFTSYTRLAPLGVILAVMPWNYPFWQAFRAAVPALLVGNGMILKHAGNVPGCALVIEKLWQQAGATEHLFSNLLIPGEQTAIAIAHPLVQGVTVTGSTETGKKIAAQCGTQLKKTVMELGGSDPYIVLADADLDLAARQCVAGRMVNGGQSCIAAKRWIVDQRVAEEFAEKAEQLLREFRSGDPLDRETTLGPMARKDLRDTLHHQVQRSVEQGARLRLGGEIPEGKGYFYPATLLTGVRPGMAVFDEETFGPVAVICPFETEQQAWEMANKTPFGLGAALFSRDIQRAEQLARQHLQAGALFINAHVRSDPRLPFGGIKQSGYGRELGKAALYEFANHQTVVIEVNL